MASNKKIDVKTIKELRERTGAPMMKVKKVLDEVKDVKKAEQILKEEGFKKAAKRADRATNAGIVQVYQHHSGKIACLIELMSETDFVAKNELFQELAKNLALQVASMGAKDAKELLKQDYIRDPKMKVEDLVKEVIAKTGENIMIGRVVRIEMGEE